MDEFILVKDLKKNKKYRKSFSKLAADTFRLDFEQWFEEGYCNDNYISYSYIHNDEVIANVSINKFTIVQNRKINKAIQLGTVMTDKNYRNKGLIRRLMNEIFKEYEEKVDFIYLFANNSVLNFYPKFGFNRVNETSYEINTENIIYIEDIKNKKTTNIKKLNLDLKEDKKIIDKMCKNRVQVSNKLGVIKDEWPLKVYCNYIYRENLYYIKDDDAVAIMERNDKELILNDILSKKPINLDNIILKILEKDDKVIIFNFIAESKKFKVSIKPKMDDDNALFVKNCKGEFKCESVFFPITSHT
ncbi:GNAT family N-acetyltransferase [Clostridium sp. MB05]|jgi:predicted GNAT family N-acyltransferase|uniref:GNAT family N-acetyltransferase n=1 Tax=Clostridium sp. MB05 TaxID=3376682 RepID=UPI003982BD90